MAEIIEEIVDDFRYFFANAKDEAKKALKELKEEMSFWRFIKLALIGTAGAALIWAYILFW